MAAAVDEMTDSNNKPAHNLTEVGVSQADQIPPLFAQVRARFDSQVSGPMDNQGWELLRTSWLGRKSGVLTLITDNWLKPSPPELKRAVGAALNELRGHVEAEIEARRAAIESGADEAALARERVDLSLPGVARPVGSHHLIRQVFQQVEDIFFSI